MRFIKGIILHQPDRRGAIFSIAQNLSAPSWVPAPPTSKPAYEGKALPIEGTVQESFVALPGSPYLGYTGRPFGGQPKGFGSTGLGGLGFALMILTSPAAQEIISGLSGGANPDPMHPSNTF